MRLLVIRHAPAGDPDAFARSGLDDAVRPITAEGRELMRAAALALSSILPPPDVLITSPLLRARQTAEIVADAFGAPDLVTSELLLPDAGMDDLSEFVPEAPRESLVAIVGHRPHLHRLVGWLLTGEDRKIVRIAKGAAVLLEFSGKRGIRKRRGKLVWALPPDQLAALAGRADAPSV